MTQEPSREQLEAAKEWYHLTFGSFDDVAIPKMAAFLAARDAETIRPWREAVGPEHYRYEGGEWALKMHLYLDPDCKICALLSSHPVPNKGESA